MVLCLKTWESRSSPGLQRTETSSLSMPPSRRRLAFDAGWSSPVARQAHNLKAAGSNPAPATSVYRKAPGPSAGGFFRALAPEPGAHAHELSRESSSSGTSRSCGSSPRRPAPSRPPESRFLRRYTSQRPGCNLAAPPRRTLSSCLGWPVQARGPPPGPESAHFGASRYAV
jgi:hypothetical protein